MESTFKSTIDMGRGSSSREVSKKYISYLHQLDGQQRRLKKTVDTAPAENATPEPGYLNGVKLVRKGRGQPPAEKKEQLWSTHGKKEVQGKSHTSSPDLLAFNPTPSQPRPLTADETRGRFMRKATHRFNQSSMSGSSMMVADVEPTFRPSRAKGTNNPGMGISDKMAKTLAFTGEADAESINARRSLLWTVATVPTSTDSIIKHNASPTNSQPAKFAERPITPAHRTVDLQESRSAFLGSLNSYAQNKVRGHYGDFTARSSGGLAVLAGF